MSDRRAPVGARRDRTSGLSGRDRGSGLPLLKVPDRLP
jgi:hypothetical protein